MVITTLDVTERKLAEEKIREQAHLIARVNETLPDLITVTELPSGQIVYANRDPHEGAGFEHEKLLDIPLGALTDLLRMHPDDAALLPDYFARVAALADHEIATFSYRTRFNSDHWRWFDVRGSVFGRDPVTGAATQLLSVAQEVTARKEAEEQLFKSYHILRQAEQVAPMGSWEYDIASGSFTWSAGMYGLFGLPMGSPIRPEIYLDYALAEDRSIARKIVEALKESHQPLEETLRLRINGKTCTVKIQAQLLCNQAGQPEKMLGVDLDISEIKRLEQENIRIRLQQQQALLNAILEAQEEERRRISESLHNGVGQILYATKLHLNRVEQLLPVKKGALLEAVEKTETLLSEAIGETRKVSHELVPILLKDYGLDKAIGDFCHRFSGSGIAFTCHGLTERLLDYLETAIYRIAQELVNNLVRHAKATRARIEVTRDEHFIYIEAQDNGQGINPEQSGKGIGLKTIQDRVTLLSGQLEIDSTPGKGTLITITLPFHSKYLISPQS